MWAFRGLRLNELPQMDCERWFDDWNELGLEYDITEYSSFDVTYDFDFNTVLVAVPTFLFGEYYIGVPRDIFNFFDSYDSIEIDDTI